MWCDRKSRQQGVCGLCEQSIHYGTSQIIEEFLWESRPFFSLQQVSGAVCRVLGGTRRIETCISSASHARVLECTWLHNICIPFSFPFPLFLQVLVSLITSQRVSTLSFAHFTFPIIFYLPVFTFVSFPFRRKLRFPSFLRNIVIFCISVQFKFFWPHLQLLQPHYNRVSGSFSHFPTFLYILPLEILFSSLERQL